MNEIVPDSGSVKVMRSHDYCHFEIVLGFAAPASLEYVDELRKNAARLADKAVEQYKIAKKDAERRASDFRQRCYDKPTITEIRAKAETDRTPEEQAQLKAYDDAVFAANRRYDYEDVWDEQDDDS